MAGSNTSTVKLILVAVGLGVAGALLAMLYLNAKEAQLREQLRPKSEPIGVVVAARDLVKGDILDANTLSVRPIPRDYVSNLAVMPGDFEKVEGLVLQQNLAAGKQLLHTFLGQEFPLDFSDTIQEKRRAMTIQVDEINSFSGLLRPGNKIDLMVRMDGAIGSSGKEVTPVLERIEVIATGRDAAYDYEEKIRLLRGGFGVNPEQNYTTLTLNVTPSEAALLSIAQDRGDIIALLRNRDDDSGFGFTSIDRDNIAENAAALAAKAELRAQASTLSDSIVVGEDGILRTRDGKVLANQNLIIGADGSIRTKSGIDLASRGLSINEKGEIVDSNGNVIDPDDLIIAADGTLMTKDGTILDGGKVTMLAGGLTQDENGVITAADGTVLIGATLNEDGMLVLADGTIVDPDDVVINSDGTVSTRDGKLLAGVTSAKSLGKLTQREDGTIVLADGTIITGATLDKDGHLVLADGTVVNPNDVIVNSDGSLGTKDGVLLAGVSASKTLGKLVQRADGTIVLADGTVITGATLDKDGNLVLADGTVVDPSKVSIDSQGRLVTQDGLVLAGVRAQAGSSIASEVTTSVDYIVGGVSKDGVATVNKVPLAE